MKYDVSKTLSKEAEKEIESNSEMSEGNIKMPPEAENLKYLRLLKENDTEKMLLSKNIVKLRK